MRNAMEKRYLKNTFTVMVVAASIAPAVSARSACVLPADSIPPPSRTAAPNFMGVGELFQHEFVSTPETASLVSIVNRPVNYSTGTPDIRIPVYTVKSGVLQIPIYLTYDASGVKVGSPSGWVGQNWTLVAEPMLTISKKGHYDNNFICELDSTQTSYTYARAVRVLDSSNPYSSIDSQPDEYYYRLSGKSGMFMYLMHPDGERYRYASLPYDNVAISVESGPWPHFVITDDDGTRYRFDGADITSSSVSGHDLGWKASSMTSANGRDTIAFEYGGLQGTTQWFHQESYQVVDRFVSSLPYGLSCRPGIYTSVNDLGLPLYNRDLVEIGMAPPVVYRNVGTQTSSYQVAAGGTLVGDNGVWGPNGVETSATSNSPRLARIRFKGNKVEFHSTGLCLDSITITNSLGEVVRRVSFGYESSSGRHFLTSLAFHNGEDGPRETYGFDYEQLTGVPGTSNKHVDFWGYLNGTPYNDSPDMVPAMWLRTLVDGYFHVGNGFQYDYRADSVRVGSEDMLGRASDEEWMKKGTLKSITYPTGGKEEFVMEANRAYLPYLEGDTDFHMSEHLRPANSERTIFYVGGLRVRQIMKVGAEGHAAVRTFTYGDDGSGRSPVVECLNYFLVEQEKYYPYMYDLKREIVSARHRTVSSSPCMPITYDNGAAVMYAKVTEYAGTEEDNIGKTVYEYSVPQYTHYFTDMDHINYHKYEDWKYGRLLSKTTYGRDGSLYVPKEREQTVYDIFHRWGRLSVGEYELRSFCSLGADEAQHYLEDVGAVFGSFLGVVNSYEIGGLVAGTKTHTVFDDGGRHKTDSTLVGYGLAHTLLPTSETTFVNGEDPFTTTYCYPENSIGQPQAASMVSANMLTPVMTTEDLRNGKSVSRKTVFNSLYKPMGEYAKFGNDESWAQRTSYIYDSNGSLVYASRDDREKVCFIYGYGGQHVIAVVENCTYGMLCSATGGEEVMAAIGRRECPTSADWAMLDGLRETLPSAHVTTCRYKPLVGVTSMTDPSGLETRFSYDGLGRLAGKSVVNNGVEEQVESYDYHYMTEGR